MQVSRFIAILDTDRRRAKALSSWFIAILDIDQGSWFIAILDTDRSASAARAADPQGFINFSLHLPLGEVPKILQH